MSARRYLGHLLHLDGWSCRLWLFDGMFWLVVAFWGSMVANLVFRSTPATAAAHLGAVIGGSLSVPISFAATLINHRLSDTHD